MSVVLYRSGPTDDEKTRLAQTALDEAKKLVNDSAFMQRLSPSDQEVLKNAVQRGEAALVMYRGVLVRQGTGPGPVGGVAMTTTTGEPMSSGAIALIAFCVAAVGVSILGQPNLFAEVGRELDNALRNLADSVGKITPQSGPIPLGFSPNLPAGFMQALAALGVIVGTGTLMAVDLEKIRELVETMRDQVETNRRLPGRMGCKDEYATFVQATLALLAALNSPPAAGDQLGLRRILKLLNDWMKAANALFMCLGMDLPFP